LVGVPTASAQTNDLILRAAYCVGVLGEQIAANKAQAPNLGIICSDWQGKGFASEAACETPLQQRAISDLEWELSRYRQYLADASVHANSAVGVAAHVLARLGAKRCVVVAADILARLGAKRCVVVAADTIAGG
jgi:hypothetical protein